MLEFDVSAKPPYKQTPATAKEQNNQERYKQALKKAANSAMKTVHGEWPIEGDVRLIIHYERAKGHMDSTNVIGGIADTLEGIVYENDSQIKEVQYVENKGEVDKYKVKIEVLRGNYG